MKNVQFTNGHSAWVSRHAEDRFRGQLVPFGALANFLPGPTGNRPKLAGATIPAIFVGYHLAPGGKWKGDYLAVSLQNCKAMNLQEEGVPTKRAISHIKEIHVTHTKPYMFPFKAMYEHLRNAVQGAVPESGLSPRAVLEALVENTSSFVLVHPEPGSQSVESYQPGSSGINCALGRATAVQRGHH